MGALKAPHCKLWLCLPGAMVARCSPTLLWHPTLQRSQSCLLHSLKCLCQLHVPTGFYLEDGAFICKNRLATELIAHAERQRLTTTTQGPAPAALWLVERFFLPSGDWEGSGG